MTRTIVFPSGESRALTTVCFLSSLNGLMGCSRFRLASSSSRFFALRSTMSSSFRSSALMYSWLAVPFFAASSHSVTFGPLSSGPTMFVSCASRSVGEVDGEDVVGADERHARLIERELRRRLDVVRLRQRAPLAGRGIPEIDVAHRRDRRRDVCRASTAHSPAAHPSFHHR